MLAKHSELDTFDSFFRTFGRPLQSKHVPQANIVEHNGIYEVKMLTPGYSKSDIKISAKLGTLVVSAETKTTDDSAKYREFSLTGFERRFSLPRTIDSEKIKAYCENGILTILLPSKESEKNTSIEIQVE